MLQDKYKSQIEKCEEDLRQSSKVFNLVGYIKLVFLLLFIGSLYLTFSDGFSAVFCIAGIIILLIQIFLWIYHSKLHDKLNYSKSLIAINKQYLDRISGDWINFDDTGGEFIDTQHIYACDLDIVGKKSLFQLLNVTNTWHGRRAFARDLLNPDYDIAELNLRQEAVCELSGDIEFSTGIQCYLSKIGISGSVSKLLAKLKNRKPLLQSRPLIRFITYYPYITIAFIAVMLVFQLKGLYFFGFALLLIQWIIWLSGINKTNKHIGCMADLPYKLGSYSKVFEILQNREFGCKKLLQIKKRLSSAAQPIKELNIISAKVGARHQGIFWFILNALFLWDYSCSFSLDAWKDKYSDSCEDWFIALGEFESLLSLSNLACVCGNVSRPVITDEDKIFEAVSLGHPLIRNDVRVTNSIADKDSIIIVSGSNMSGKTTFLRTIGINLVLANAGGFVCAKAMTCSRFKLITSMRISDNLSEGISTFYAELIKIKRIIDAAKNNEHIFFFIDEIFRGTNSVDRLFGAKTVISKLDSFGAMGIITTHDLELCELENQLRRIKNYSFSEHYSENKILFDYKMKQGKSSTTNAKYLMQILGII